MKKRIFSIVLLAALALTGCGALGKPENIESKWTLTQAGAITLSDGTTLDLWNQSFFSRNYYKLADETEILVEEMPSGPENVYVGGRESFHDLPETARTAISAHYEARGVLYDLTAEAEKAYGAYLDCRAEGKDFSAFLVGQSTSLCASNEHVVYFLTSLTLPLDVQYCTEDQTGDAFDRATGEVIPTWELFAVSEDEAKAFIVEQFLPQSDAERKEMQEKLLPEYLVFQPEHLSVFFPLGVISTQEYSAGTGIDYAELAGVLHSWAVPGAMK